MTGLEAAGMPVDTSDAPTGSAVGTGYVYDDRYLEHQIYSTHPESPRRLRAIEQRFAESGIGKELAKLPIDAFDDSHLRLNHTESHIEAISAMKTTGRIAQLAVAGAFSAVDAVCTGRVRNGFCALRPPGHHAKSTGREEGFCFYNNVALAARYAQKVHKKKKILIIDWDYHHGNGTEWSFYDDPTVFFFSTHDRRAYPGTGDPRKTGAGDGEGYNINVHLGCGAKDDEMYRAWEKHLIPAADEYKPDLVLISAGFDSRKDDLLGCYDLTDICFSRMTKMAMEIADRHCEGRVVSLLEGGYNVAGLAEAAAAHVSTLLGKA